ncbi:MULTISPECIES: enoyl-CoA hydratase/isomerase family protein [Rhodococcus]|uniref:enoyl-CoA hydratase/isomerase family protein n=1 Tax=Rhodococcus TaxID=1827 RepID=UPI0002DF70BE|nr:MULTISPECIES: enoyl-CoA hydratase/isomerase family protein [Rhodococcus]AHK35808.1 3-hydroxybutyryl-CoA dehydratase [Rhodococcus opacus PD630]UDH01422.1 enoyl-CoA hydratase/isomerase family protein [Rhodococcus opacus PD630]
MTLDVVDRVAHLTINRPEKRNAMSMEMWTSLAGHIRSIDQANDISAVVLRGAGGSFSAGGDLTELRSPDPGHSKRYRDLAETTVVALMDLELPKLAAIDGPCFGAGCSLALACDVRISSFSSQFGIPALRNGLVYEPIFVRRLVQIVGSGPAGLLLYGAERWTADEAAAHGLVDKLTEDVSAAVENILKCLRGANGAAISSTATSIRTTPQFS